MLRVNQLYVCRLNFSYQTETSHHIQIQGTFALKDRNFGTKMSHQGCSRLDSRFPLQSFFSAAHFDITEINQDLVNIIETLYQKTVSFHQSGERLNPNP